MQENQKSGGLSWSQPAEPHAPGAGMKPVSSLLWQANKTETPKVEPTVQKGSTKKLVGVFIAGLVVGALVGWSFAAARNTAENKTDTLATSPSSGSVADTAVVPTIGANSTTADTSGFSVPSPQRAGLRVSVAHISVSAPTWVVIYEENNGIPGNALGAALFGSATQSGVVDLLRGTLPGQSYIAGEALDDGDRIFSLQNDKPVRDQNGNPLWVQFKTN